MPSLSLTWSQTSKTGFLMMRLSYVILLTVCYLGFDNQFTRSGFSYIWARPGENVSYAICEQPRCRSACASAQSDQHLCCSLPRQNNTSSLLILNFKILAGLCSWAGQFVSCLVGDSRRHIFSWRGSFYTAFPHMRQMVTLAFLW